VDNKDIDSNEVNKNVFHKHAIILVTQIYENQTINLLESQQFGV